MSLNYWQNELTSIRNTFFLLGISAREHGVSTSTLEVALQHLDKMREYSEKIIEDLQPSLDDEQYTSSVEMQLEDLYGHFRQQLVSLLEEIVKESQSIIDNEYGNPGDDVPDELNALTRVDMQFL